MVHTGAGRVSQAEGGGVGAKYFFSGPKCPPRKALYTKSGGVRVQFRVRFQAVKVPTFGGFPVENTTKKATASKPFERQFLCTSTVRRGSEYG